MTNKELEEIFEEFKAQGESEEKILAVLYLMFQDDKIDLEELGAMADVLGYELTPEFLAMSPEDQKTKGYKQVDEEEEDEEDFDINDEGEKIEILDTLTKDELLNTNKKYVFIVENDKENSINPLDINPIIDDYTNYKSQAIYATDCVNDFINTFVYRELDYIVGSEYNDMARDFLADKKIDLYFEYLISCSNCKEYVEMMKFLHDEVRMLLRIKVFKNVNEDIFENLNEILSPCKARVLVFDDINKAIAFLNKNN